MADIPHDELASRIELRGGVMIWRPRNQRRFDEQCAGKPVTLRTASNGGYRYIRINRREIMAHRAIWALHYGQWPAGVIDHINGDTSDNRIENLRDCDTRTNSRNKARQRNNTTGCAGVVRANGKWRAQIVVNDSYRHLGMFDSFEEAVGARLAANSRYGFTERHGVEAAGGISRGGVGGSNANGFSLCSEHGEGL